MSVNRRTLKQIDTETGEIHEGFVAVISKKRQNGFTDGWIAMNQQSEFLLKLASSKVGDEARRVFFALITHVDYENHILVAQAEMSKKIDMAPSNFSRGVKRLIEEGVIEKGPKIGRMTSLKLNPHYGWKGQASAHVIALDDRRNRLEKEMKDAAKIDTKKKTNLSVVA